MSLSNHDSQNIPPRDARTAVHRLAERGKYDFETISSILDEGVICHVGFVQDGLPFVIPTGYARIGETLYLHGSPGSRMLRCIAEGSQVCITVTLLDGLVLARSIFHHSMNYRSAVIFGTGTLIDDPITKNEALRAFSEHMLPGRWDEVRQPSEDELRGTLVVAFPITEASAKIRTGPPKDDEEDYLLPIWAGVVPLKTSPLAPVADERNIAGVVLPNSVRAYYDHERPLGFRVVLPMKPGGDV